MIADTGGDWATLRQDGERLQLWTGPRALRYQRIQVKAVALAFVVGGGLLLRYSPWAWAAVAVGPLAWALASRLAPERALIEVDRGAGRLIPLAGGGTDGAPVDLGRIRAIAGAWETFGWSSRGAIYAVEDGGAPTLVLALEGTNDAYAAAMCAALGRLLGVTATYTGTSGAPLPCFEPPVP